MAGLVIGLISLAGTAWLTGIAVEHERQEHQSRVVLELATVRAQLESELNTTMHLTHGLTALVASDPGLTEEQFKRISAELLRRSRHTSHLVLAPDNVITHVYPLAGNEAAVGLDLAAHPRQREAVLRAMERRGLVITGPVQLVQGGVALATREPVFLRENAGERYWGLVTAVIIMESLFEAAGLRSDDLGLDVALRNLDDDTALMGDQTLFERDNQRQQVQLSGITWELAAEPAGGGASIIPYWQALGVGLSLAAGLAGWRLSSQRLALANSEHKYRAVVDHLNDGVCIAQDGILRFVNPRMREICGYTEEEVLGRPLTMLVPGRDGERLLERHHQRMQGFSAPAEYEVGLIRKDGEKLHVRLNTSLVDWQGRAAALGTVTDITERKRLEDALRSSRDRLQAMIQALPDVAVILDDRGTYLNLFGGPNRVPPEPSERLLGKRLVDVLPEKLAQQFLGVIQAAISSDRLQTFEYLLSSRDDPSAAGTGDQWFEGRVVPLHAYEHERPTVLWLAFNITDHKRAETALREREAAFQALVENSPDVIARLDPDLRVLYINSAVERYAGLPAGSLLGRRRPETLQDPMLGQLLEENYGKAFRERQTHVFEFRMRSPDGQVLFFESRVIPERGEKEEIASVLVLERDVTQRKRSDNQLRLAASVFQHTSESMLVTDAHRRVVRCNPAYTRLTEYRIEEIVGRPSPLLTTIDQGGMMEPEAWDTLLDAGHWEGELLARRRSGEPFPAWVTVNGIRDDANAISHFLLTLEDISSRKRHEAQLRHDATHDPLTGLPNRTLLLDRLRVSMAQARRNEQELALLFIDLDGFKPVNDAHGHRFGDAMLGALAQRLRESVRDTDTVARHGGDEFIVVLSPPSDLEVAEAIAGEILEQLARPVTVQGIRSSVGASIGISRYPADGTEAEALIMAADTAMYRAKAEGRGRACYFSGSPPASSRTRPD